MLGLGLRWFKWASKNADLCIVDLFPHLWMRELLVDNNTFDELGIFNGTTSLGDDLDEVKVYILTFKVSNMENSLHSQVCVVILALAHYLGAECSSGTLSEEFIIVLLNVKWFFNLVYSVHCDVTSALKSISDFQRVDTLVKQLLCLLKDSSGKNDNSSGTIADFIVLGCRKLSEQLGSLMMNLS